MYTFTCISIISFIPYHSSIGTIRESILYLFIIRIKHAYLFTFTARVRRTFQSMKLILTSSKIIMTQNKRKITRDSEISRDFSPFPFLSWENLYR